MKKGLMSQFNHFWRVEAKHRTGWQPVLEMLVGYGNVSVFFHAVIELDLISIKVIWHCGRKVFSIVTLVHPIWCTKERQYFRRLEWLQLGDDQEQCNWIWVPQHTPICGARSAHRGRVGRENITCLCTQHRVLHLGPFVDLSVLMADFMRVDPSINVWI